MLCLNEYSRSTLTISNFDSQKLRTSKNSTNPAATLNSYSYIPFQGFGIYQEEDCPQPPSVSS